MRNKCLLEATKFGMVGYKAIGNILQYMLYMVLCSEKCIIKNTLSGKLVLENNRDAITEMSQQT